MIKYIITFLLFTSHLFGQISKKEFGNVPSVLEVIQPEPIVLTIGKKTYTTTEFNVLYKRNLQFDSLPEKTPKQFLENFVSKQLRILKAESEGLDTTKTFKEEIATIRSQIMEGYLTEKPVQDALIKEAYERMKTEINVSHILIPINESDTLDAFTKVMQVKEKLGLGESFENLALQYSKDNLVNKNKGNLGYITALQTIYSFENAVYNTAIGKYSNPFKTPFGYHILKINAKRDYQRTKTAHILVSVGSDNEEAAKRKIDEAYSLLQAGELFENVCKKYSEDETTNSKGGIFNRLFGPDELEKPFEDALYAIKKNGNYSIPIKTSKGWHIIRLITKEELKSYNEMAYYLKTKVLSDKRSELIKAAYLKRIKKENNFLEYQSVVSDAFQIVDSCVKLQPSINKLTPTLSGKPLFSINKKEILVGSYFKYVLEKLKVNKDKYSKNKLYQWYTEFVDKENYEYEKSNLENKNPEFKDLMTLYRDDLLIQGIINTQLLPKTLIDTTSQRKYFQKNIQNYQWPDRISAKVTEANNQINLQKALGIFKKEPFPLSIKWNDLYFGINQFAINTTQAEHLRNLCFLLIKNPNYQIEIAGNIDPDEQETISMERIKTIVDYLKTKGINISRIIEKDNSKFQPLSKTEREKNRRVSFAIFTTAKEDVVKVFNALKPESLKYSEGFYKKGDDKIIDGVKWEVGNYQLDKSGRYYSIEVEKVENTRPMTLDEARGKVIMAIQAEAESSLNSKLIASFPVIINEEQLKKISK